MYSILNLVIERILTNYTQLGLLSFIVFSTLMLFISMHYKVCKRIITLEYALKPYI